MDSCAAVMNYPRRDARDKLRGRTRYTVDRALVGTLHGAVLRSETAAARVVKLDVSRAEAMPGVRAVVTAQDAPGLHGIGVADQPLFALDTIRHHGEALAAVAADTQEIANAALSLIRVEIEPLPAAVTLEEALRADAPLVHPDWRSYEVLFEGASRGGNVAWEATVIRGDTDGAFGRSDVTIVENDFRVGRQNHLSFEPRAVIATYEDGRYHIETSTQAPWTVRNVTARILQAPASAVRVTVPAVGGGFGLKFDCALEPFAALLARKSGRPVKLVNSRQEEMLTGLCRENAELRIRSAVAKDGEIVGREAVVLMDCGAYGGEQIFLTTMTAHTLLGNYRLGSVKLVSRAVYTNTAPNGAFRACNGVYNTFALEQHTDEIAARIGMDPLAFRRRNVLGDGSLGSTGQVFAGDVLGPMLDRMAEIRASRPSREPEAAKRLYGRATTVGTWFVFVGPSAATINLNADGSASVITAGVEIGSGTMVQAVPQIVAAELGLRPEDVIVRTADTDAAGYDVGVGGGRTTVSIGAASRAAAIEVRGKLLAVAVQMLQTPPEKLELRAGRVEIAGIKGSGTTVAKVAQHAQELVGPLSGVGSFTNSPAASQPGCARGHFIDALEIPIFAVHDCEVAVDPETGHVEVLGYTVVQDVGRALNPRAIASQVQGGVVQGLGYALHEEITLDPEGRIRQTGLETYRVPLATDVIPVEVHLHEGAPSRGPLGTKGAGEVPILNVAASVACAVSNATGRRAEQIPLTPPRVLAMMLGNTPKLHLRHIAKEWWDNVLMRPARIS